ncbi:Ig domain-containing protein [Marinobacter sp. VGCF2001]|uniref:Ig domain-containing protein n=1 Tax=Marinobacter sp. VGCF2001 TaxID=3417189 RepID=UPI003CFBBBA0
MFFRKTAVLGLTGILLAGCGGSSSDSDESPSQPQADISASINLPAAVATVEYRYRVDHQPLSGDVRYSAEELPKWASIDPATGVISGEPTQQDVSAQSPVVVEATNGSRTLHLKGSQRGVCRRLCRRTGL